MSSRGTKLQKSKWNKTFRDKHNTYIKDRYQKARKEIFELYNNECSNCHHKDIRVLQLDHKNRDKYGSRLNNRRIGLNLCRSILNGTYPKEDFQLLCANCNWLKRLVNNERYPVTTSAGSDEVLAPQEPKDQ
jgi:hypothetical protein